MIPGASTLLIGAHRAIYLWLFLRRCSGVGWCRGASELHYARACASCDLGKTCA